MEKNTRPRPRPSKASARLGAAFKSARLHPAPGCCLPQRRHKRWAVGMMTTMPEGEAEREEKEGPAKTTGLEPWQRQRGLTQVEPYTSKP